MNARPTSPPFDAMIEDAIQAEFASLDWNQPHQTMVGELGIAMGSHPGLKRSRNEDRIAVARVEAPDAESYTVALVCDGVGGSEYGDQAAVLAITAVLHDICIQRHSLPIQDVARHAVRRADEYVRQRLGGRGTTTLSMFLGSNLGNCACVNVGDSRVYSWSPGSQVVQVTTDDTVENELKAVPGDHDALLKARGLKGRLSQAIGESDRSVDELRVQVFQQEHFRDGILLGSDGLWKIVKDFEAVVTNVRHPVDAVRRAINLANWVGGIDNSSLIAIEDFEKFCRVAPLSPSAFRSRSLTLWIGPTRAKFSEGWGIPPVVAEPIKPKKVVKKTGKSKKANQVRDGADAQLEILETKPHSMEPQPEIQISFGSSSGKDKE